MSRAWQPLRAASWTASTQASHVAAMPARSVAAHLSTLRATQLAANISFSAGRVDHRRGGPACQLLQNAGLKMQLLSGRQPEACLEVHHRGKL